MAYAAFDFGISYTDVIVDADGKRASEYFPSDTPASAERIGKLLAHFGLQTAQLDGITVTGGHSARLPEAIDGVPVRRVNEVEALGASAAELLGDVFEMPLLVLNAGSGTTCVLVSPSGFAHVGGNATGGGTLVGLGQLLLGTNDATEIGRLAAQGQPGKVDLNIGDVVSGPIGSLPKDATAVNFGRLIREQPEARREDIAAGLTTLIGQSIALTGLSTALATGANTLCVVGRTPQLLPVRAAMERVLALPLVNLKTVFPDQGYLACALGALALGRGRE